MSGSQWNLADICGSNEWLVCRFFSLFYFIFFSFVYSLNKICARPRVKDTGALTGGAPHGEQADRPVSSTVGTEATGAPAPPSALALSFTSLCLLKQRGPRVSSGTKTSLYWRSALSLSYESTLHRGSQRRPWLEDRPEGHLSPELLLLSPRQPPTLPQGGAHTSEAARLLVAQWSDPEQKPVFLSALPRPMPA